jgi:beta-aspartyl-peptidase (threonine type)
VSERNRIAVIVHGGAGMIPDTEAGYYRAATSAAAALARDLILGGNDAVAAACAAVRLMEDDRYLNAGYGSVLDENGEMWFDASVMEGRTMRAGAIAAIPSVLKNPVELARLVMENHPSVLLAGEGALEFARECGLDFVEPQSMVSERQRERWERWKVKAAERAGNPTDDSGLPVSPGQPEAEDYNAYDALVNRNLNNNGNNDDNTGDTVGAVVRDSAGMIAVALSTGGVRGKPRGRVGDTPVVGCGLYCDDAIGGAGATGIGEHIIRAMLSGRAVLAMESRIGLAGSTSLAQFGAEEACRYMHARIGGNAGVIVLDRDGNIGYAHTTPRMAVAYWMPGMDEPATDMDGRKIG